jgi:TolA-binding protein
VWESLVESRFPIREVLALRTINHTPKEQSVKTKTKLCKTLVSSTLGLFFLVVSCGFAGQQPAEKAAHDQSDSAATASRPAQKNSSVSVKKDQGSDAETAALKKQLTEQQEQINKLLGTVQQLQQRLQADEQAQSSSQASPQLPAAGTVASLAPVLPRDSSNAKSDALMTAIAANPAAVGAAGQGKEQKLGPLAFKNVQMGVTVFGDYGLYTSTGFGPQFITQINQPGPYNAGFNSFDITRTYLNFFWTPTDAITLRVTPNLYRQVDTTAGAQTNGKGASFGGSTNGNLTVRIKYAYVDFNTLFKGSDAFGKDKVTFGQTTNPLVDWEEGLYGFRFVNLVPWNYLSLSSTYGGVKIHGPIEFNGKEYLDYDLGAFNTQSFHSLELTDQKQVMGRLTWYPVGTKTDRTGFGVTVFEDYGSNGKTPDTHSVPDYRFAALASYQTHKKGYQIAGEFDLGRNSFSTGNLFSGVGPVAGGPYDLTNTLASAILSGDRVKEKGYAAFGHADIPHSPFTLFGTYEYWKPNTNITKDPFDFERFVGGVDYKFNKYLDLALDYQSLIYTKGQFTFPAGKLSTGATIKSAIPNAVPGNTNAIFMNMQFNY